MVAFQERRGFQRTLTSVHHQKNKLVAFVLVLTFIGASLATCGEELSTRHLHSNQNQHEPASPRGARVHIFCEES